MLSIGKFAFLASKKVRLVVCEALVMCTDEVGWVGERELLARDTNTQNIWSNFSPTHVSVRSFSCVEFSFFSFFFWRAGKVMLEKKRISNTEILRGERMWQVNRSWMCNHCSASLIRMRVELEIFLDAFALVWANFPFYWSKSNINIPRGDVYANEIVKSLLLTPRSSLFSAPATKLILTGNPCNFFCLFMNTFAAPHSSVRRRHEALCSFGVRLRVFQQWFKIFSLIIHDRLWWNVAFNEEIIIIEKKLRRGMFS